MEKEISKKGKNYTSPLKNRKFLPSQYHFKCRLETLLPNPTFNPKHIILTSFYSLWYFLDTTQKLNYGRVAQLIYIYIFLSIHQVSIVIQLTGGTQREYSSRPLKNDIVKRVLVFNGGYGHIFIPYKFFICSDFLAEGLVIRKL